MSFEWVMPSNHLVLCRPLLLLPSIFPSIRVFSNESALHIRWPKYWSYSISPSNEHLGLISLQSKGLSRVFSSTTVQKHQFFGAQLSLQSNSHIHTWLLLVYTTQVYGVCMYIYMCVCVCVYVYKYIYVCVWIKTHELHT